MIPPRIAVVHSDTSVSTLLVTLLDEEGYLPILVENIERAREEFESALPDLIIIDIGYGPSHLGWILARQFRLDSSTRHIPIVALTTSNDPEAVRPPGSHSQFEILSSPFDINIVLGAVRSLLKSPQHCHCT